MKLLLAFLLIATAAGAQQANLSEYAFALTGELAACKKYQAECEAQQRTFAMHVQEREREAQREIQRLKSEIQRLKKQKQDLLKRKQSLEAESNIRKQEINALLPILTAAEQNLEKQKGFLPDDLRETLLPPLKGEDIAARTSRYIDTVAAIEDFAENMQKPFPQKINFTDGSVQEYQVLMCGLSLALAYSDGTGNAGIGVRNGECWQWTWNKKWHGPIKKAAEICSGSRPSELLPLPILDIINAGSDR